MTKQKRALVVDDDQDFLFQQKTALEALGWVVTTAEGRKEACDVLDRETPDLAVIDLMMEEKDGGFVLARHIKKLNPQIPVILVTAVTSETGITFDKVGDAAKGKWIMADAVLAKPIRFEQLRKEIERLVP
jgi:two-component system, OmpR family, response regulator